MYKFYTEKSYIDAYYLIIHEEHPSVPSQFTMIYTLWDLCLACNKTEIELLTLAYQHKGRVRGDRLYFKTSKAAKKFAGIVFLPALTERALTNHTVHSDKKNK